MSESKRKKGRARVCAIIHCSQGRRLFGRPIIPLTLYQTWVGVGVGVNPRHIPACISPSTLHETEKKEPASLYVNPTEYPPILNKYIASTQKKQQQYYVVDYFRDAMEIKSKSGYRLRITVKDEAEENHTWVDSMPDREAFFSQLSIHCAIMTI